MSADGPTSWRRAPKKRVIEETLQPTLMVRLDSPEGEDGGEAAASSELWTLLEEAQGVAPSFGFVPLARRPASFSISSGNNNNPQPPPTADIAARGRADSCDAVGNEDLSGAGNLGDRASGAACPIDSEGFPLLLRRRTFTEPSLSKRRCYHSPDNDGGGVVRRGYHRADSDGGSGSVPMSVSEDNMLSLLSKRSSQTLDARRAPRTPATTPVMLDRDMAFIRSISNSSGSSMDADSEGVGGAAGEEPMQQHEERAEEPSQTSERARRNEFVIRYLVTYCCTLQMLLGKSRHTPQVASRARTCCAVIMVGTSYHNPSRRTHVQGRLSPLSGSRAFFASIYARSLRFVDTVCGTRRRSATR